MWGLMDAVAAIGLEQAQAAVLAEAAPLPAVAVAPGEALGLHLAENVVATEPLQGFDNSAMDGFAVRAADVAEAGPGAATTLTVIGESRAGRPATVAVGPGEAVAISTGAMVPAGADAVVRIEDTAVVTAGVAVEAAASPGQNVRRAGEDVGAGETVLRRGDRIGAAELAVLAALGQERVGIHRRPRVSIVVSGDELVAAGAPVAPGAVRDSNSPMLAALVVEAGAELQALGHAGDSLQATAAAIEPALEADVVIVCGGISVGAHDHVKGAFGQLGVESRFWRVALKPGGPTWFGCRGGTLAFGLPGNPVSAFVTFVLFVAPALAALAGARPEARRLSAVLAAPYEKRSGRTEAIRCTLEPTDRGCWRADPRPHQGSHVLSSLLGAGCLALLPSPARRVAAGERVEIVPLGGARVGR